MKNCVPRPGDLLIGLGVCALLWFAQRMLIPPPPSAGPYFSSADPGEVFRGYMRHWASHRSVPWGTGHIALAAALVLSCGAAFGRPARSDYGWVAMYVALTAAAVWGIMAIHLLTGAGIPRLLIAWMPYRLINHASPLLIPLMVALLSTGPGREKNQWLVFLALAYGLCAPLSAAVLPEAFHARYVATGEAVYFALAGASAAVIGRRLYGSRGRALSVGWMCAAGAGWMLLASRHQYGALCAAAGLAAALPLGRTVWPAPPKAALHAVLVSLLVFLTAHEARHREHLPVTPFEQQVRTYLHEQGEDGAMILVRYQQESLQARLHHPVMTRYGVDHLDSVQTRAWPGV